MLSVPGILSPDFHTNLAKIPALLNRGVSAVVLRPRTRKDPTRVFIRFHRWLPTLLQRHFCYKDSGSQKYFVDVPAGKNEPDSTG